MFNSYECIILVVLRGNRFSVVSSYECTCHPNMTGCKIYHISFFITVQGRTSVIHESSKWHKMFISGYVTLRNDSCNLCRNDATKLRDKLQEKLPSVTAPQFKGVSVYSVSSPCPARFHCVDGHALDSHRGLVCFFVRCF